MKQLRNESSRRLTIPVPGELVPDDSPITNEIPHSQWPSGSNYSLQTIWQTRSDVRCFVLFSPPRRNASRSWSSFGGALPSKRTS